MAKSDQRIIPGRYQVVPRTLCFVFHGTDVLLLRGAPDKQIWPNCYNGVGGHVEAGEDVRSAAEREIQEETGVAIRDLRLRGVVNSPSAVPGTGVVLFVFTARATTRQSHASIEGDLEWVSPSQFATLQMVEDVPVLLERISVSPPDGEPFFARYTYSNDDELEITFVD